MPSVKFGVVRQNQMDFGFPQELGLLGMESLEGISYLGDSYGAPVRKTATKSELEKQLKSLQVQEKGLLSQLKSATDPKKKTDLIKSLAEVQQRIDRIEDQLEGTLLQGKPSRTKEQKELVDVTRKIRKAHKRVHRNEAIKPTLPPPARLKADKENKQILAQIAKEKKRKEALQKIVAKQNQKFMAQQAALAKNREAKQNKIRSDMRSFKVPPAHELIAQAEPARVFSSSDEKKILSQARSFNIDPRSSEIQKILAQVNRSAKRHANEKDEDRKRRILLLLLLRLIRAKSDQGFTPSASMPQPPAPAPAPVNPGWRTSAQAIESSVPSEDSESPSYMNQSDSRQRVEPVSRFNRDPEDKDDAMTEETEQEETSLTASPEASDSGLSTPVKVAIGIGVLVAGYFGYQWYTENKENQMEENDLDDDLSVKPRSDLPKNLD